MTRIERISADYVGFNRNIREDSLNPRYPRSIPFIPHDIDKIQLFGV